MTREEAHGEKGDVSLERGGITKLVNDIYDETQHILIDISEYDAETFKELVFGRVDDNKFSWLFETEEGTKVEITFRRELDEDNS